MAVLDELSINVSADTADFRAGAEGVESSLDDISSEALQTAASLQILQGRTDEAGDEMTQLSAKSGVASGALTTLSNSAFGTQVAFLGLSVATTASLIPALVSLSAAIAPIVGALGGFVAIAVAIGGIGLGGTIAAIATNLELFQSEATRVLETLQDAFAPAIQEAQTVLLLLIRDFEDLIPSLVPSQEAIDAIGQNFLELGQALLGVLPALSEVAVTLTQDFLPGFVEFVEDVGPDLPDIILGLVDTFDRLLPQLLEAGELLAEFLPVFTEFGFTVLDVVGPALSSLTQTLTNAFRGINNLSQGIGELIAGGSLLAPVVIGLASLLGGPLTAGLFAIVGGVAGVAAAFRSNFANVRDIVTGVSNQIQSVMPAAKSAFNAFVEGVNIQSITDSFAAFESVLGDQLIKTFEALKPVYSDLITFFRENQDEFETIGEAFGTLIDTGIRLATVFVNLIFPAIRNFVIPAISAGIDALDFLIDKLATAIELTQAVSAGDFEAATQIGLGAIGTSEQQFAQQIQADQQAQQDFNSRVEVIVEGDTDVVKDVAARTVDEQSRQQRRNNGTPTGL